MKLDYTDLTFEFFSAKYLNMWMQQERHIHAALQNPDAHGVRKGLAYFVVSRGFPDIDNEKVGKKIAEMLIKADRYVTAKTAPSRVMELAKSFDKDFDFNLSAASKLLWLRSRSPFLILDSRAVRALKLNAKFDERDYAAYSGEWHKAFEGHQPNILKAISKLPNFMKFTAASNVPKDELRSFIQEDWFVERVFDQYLWTVGKPVDKNAKAA